MLWLFLCPVFCLLLAHFTPQCRKGTHMMFSSLECDKTLLWRLLYARYFPFHCLHQLLVLNSDPHTFTPRKRGFDTVVMSSKTTVRKLHVCFKDTIHYIMTQRSSQTFISWSIKYSTTWIFLLQNQIDHALLHICLCIHMQCLQLHVCMSMRPMVLSMICLIYGLDTLITH